MPAALHPDITDKHVQRLKRFLILYLNQQPVIPVILSVKQQLKISAALLSAFRLQNLLSLSTCIDMAEHSAPGVFPAAILAESF